MPNPESSLRRLPSLAACALAFATAGASPLFAQSPQAAEDCDRLAASPSDSSRPAGTPGVEVGRIETAAAIPACREAVALDPQNARRLYQLGRALDAAKNPEAAEAYAAAEALGHALAANNLGVFYLHGRPEGPAQDVDRGMSLLKRSAELGSGVGALNLGIHHRDGTLIPRDRKAALSWFRTSAKLGDPEGNRLAARLLEAGGEGSPADHEAAAVHWRALAETADPEALARIGIAIEQKLIAPLSPAEMTDRLSAASTAGRPDAAAALARHHLKGEGPEQAALAAEQAWRAFQIFAAAPTDEEFGWLPYQLQAAVFVQQSVAKGAEFPGTPEDYALLQRDFDPRAKMATLTTKILCGETEAPFDLRIWTWGRDHPQTDPQIEWLREARGCLLDETEAENYRQVFKIAAEHGVEWPELLTAALNRRAPAQTAAPAQAPPPAQAPAPQRLAPLEAPGIQGPHPLARGASASFSHRPSDASRFLTYRVNVPAGSFGILGLARLEGAGKMGIEIGSGVEPGDMRRARISGRIHADSTSDNPILALIEPSGSARSYVVQVYARDDLPSSWRIRFENFVLAEELGEAFAQATLETLATSLADAAFCTIFTCARPSQEAGRQNVDRAVSTLFTLAGGRDVCGVGASLLMRELEREVRRELGTNVFLTRWFMGVAGSFVAKAAWTSCVL